MSELVQTNKLKITYMKALMLVHPDKNREKPLEDRLLAERIFDLLTQAKKNETSF